MVVFETSHGTIKMEMFPEEAPVTVENFLQYVDDGHFDGTIFHRVMPGFVIQGGGFTAEMEQKDTRDPIKNEADNGLKNERGSLSMAPTFSTSAQNPPAPMAAWLQSRARRSCGGLRQSCPRSLRSACRSRSTA